MKTSVIEVHAMLSVLSVDEVEKRIGEVPGVESVTVNFAAENATVRYDETRLEVADIKSALRLRAHEPKALEVDTSVAAAPQPAPAAAPAEPAAGATPAPMPEPGAHTMPAGMTMPGMDVPAAEAANASKPATSPESAAPAPDTSLFQKLKAWLSPATAEDKAASPAPAVADPKGHAGHGGTSSPMSSDMAQEMGHGGNMDLPAMVRDMRTGSGSASCSRCRSSSTRRWVACSRRLHRPSACLSTSGCSAWPARPFSTRAGRSSWPPGVRC